MSYKIWSGYVFENLCFKHTEQIKKTFGINDSFDTPSV